MFTILLIENNYDIRENVTELLELEGYRMITAHDGATGIQLAGKHLPDLILSDIVMGPTDGYSVFQSILSIEATKNIPFIFATARSENIDREKGLAIGVCEFLIKPFDDTELLTCITKVLNRYQNSP